MRTLVCNIESEDRSRHFEELMKDRKPHIGGVLQAYRARPWLAEWAPKHDYRLRQLRGRGEADEIAALIHRDIELMKVQYLRMEEPWVGGKAGVRHGPRVYIALRVRVNGVVSLVVLLHLPTHNATKAQAESVRKLTRYADSHPRTDIALLGDWNKRNEKEMREVRAEIGGDLHRVGSVDYGIIRPGKGNRLESDSTSLRQEMQPGAHGWGMYTWNRK